MPDFATAIADESLILHYQPIVDLGRERIVGYEALARWQRDGTLWQPYQFVDALNASDTLPQWLSLQVRQVNAALASLPSPQWVSLNISNEALRLPSLGTILDAVTDRTRLRLEISELVPLGDYEVGALRDLHWDYHLAADDFGCRGSDVGRLIEAELFDSIKLDARLTQGVATDLRKGKICAFVLGLAETLCIGSVAEWVEDPGQAEWLAEYGCGNGQGCRFGMPEPLWPQPFVQD